MPKEVGYLLQFEKEGFLQALYIHSGGLYPSIKVAEQEANSDTLGIEKGMPFKVVRVSGVTVKKGRVK